MKIGIFVHSKTGNTDIVTEKLKRQFIRDGYLAEIHKIDPIGGEPDNPQASVQVEFSKVADVSGFDGLIFAGPVRAFGMSPILEAYIKKLDTLQDKKVKLLVTQHLPYPWMGGTNAIRQMKRLCISKGATVLDSGIINWKNSNKDKKIITISKRFSNQF